ARRVRPGGSRTPPPRSPARAGPRRRGCRRWPRPPRRASSRSPDTHHPERLGEHLPVVERQHLTGDLLAALVTLAEHGHHVGGGGGTDGGADRLPAVAHLLHLRAAGGPGTGEDLRPDPRRVLR